MKTTLLFDGGELIKKHLERDVQKEWHASSPDAGNGPRERERWNTVLVMTAGNNSVSISAVVFCQYHN